MALLALPSGSGAQTSPIVLPALAGSTLTIRGSTTVGARWHCSAAGVESRVAIAEREGQDVPDVRGVAVHLPVSALRCQSGPMERAMRHALKADRDTAATSISGRFEIVDEFAPPQDNQRDLVGALRVAGRERNVYLRAFVSFDADGAMRVRSVVPLTLSAFEITPPRVLFGAVRARDAITVEVELLYPRPTFAAANGDY
jgi:hypothetical protein